MVKKRLYVFVEGDDDNRYFKRILEPILTNYFVQIIEYSGLTQKKAPEFINSIQSMGADYLFLHDLDCNPCITQCKHKVTAKYRGFKTLFH